MIQIIRSGDRAAVDRLLAPPAREQRAVLRRAARIVADVRREGDAALRRYVAEYDGVKGRLELDKKEIQRRAAQASPRVRSAMRLAARHIARVARAQLPRGFRVRVAPGVVVEQRVRPLERVGCYVPGGRYPLPSTLLMTAIPARVAGVSEIVVACPRPDAVVCAAALEAGVSRLFRIGGAQAIAALAFGTRSVPRVDRIVGPGNKYVAAAKTCVSTECAIDFQAGPTEIVIVSERGNPEWIAADLLAQAEHDPDARAVLITPRLQLAHLVAAEVARHMPADGPARASIERHGAIVVTGSLKEALELANRIAPEHLVVDDRKQADAVASAGSIFIGPHTAQVAGDYAIGSNHVLPTGGAARVRGGLHAADFVKVVTVQQLTPRGLKALGRAVTLLARAEGLHGHARSIDVRLS